VTGNVAVFAVAALLEIAGCFAFRAWLRRGVTPFVLTNPLFVARWLPGRRRTVTMLLQ
jgi:drug/metabolite transporter superfamily protein YnfA